MCMIAAAAAMLSLCTMARAGALVTERSRDPEGRAGERGDGERAGEEGGSVEGEGEGGRAHEHQDRAEERAGDDADRLDADPRGVGGGKLLVGGQVR